MSFGSSDLSIFFADFGATCVFGATTFRANLDVASEQLDNGSGLVVIGRTRVITYPTSTITLHRGSTGTVDGVSYEVTHVMTEDDGLISKAYLEVPA